MISAGEIYDYIDSIAPFSTAMDFDNVGLLIGSRESSSELVILALDLTGEVLEEAVEKGAGIVVTHHPVIFSPLKKLSPDSIQYKAVSRGITVICAHTDLDIAPGGVNDSLAAAIGVISENGTDEDCFLVGKIKESLSASELADRIIEALDCKGIRFTDRNGNISRVAVACGAGGGSIFAAAQAGADAFVTGEIKHHELIFARENNIAVFDLGHFRSEDHIMEILKNRLSSRFDNAVFEKAASDMEYTIYRVALTGGHYGS